LAPVPPTAVSMAESKAKRGEVGVKLAVPEDLPLIQGDEHQLCQVFTNLVINAFEALGGTGHVRISAAPGTIEEEPVGKAEAWSHIPTVVIAVQDDGPGIAGDLQDRVFNAFFTTKAQGSGLGLAIVWRS